MGEIRVFLGFDPREAAAYHVCVQSILDNTDPNGVSIHPVCGERRDGSNTFVYARFLTPYRCHFQGWAIWLDGDMIVRSDIRELWSYQRPYVGALVVKHDYKTKYPTKYLGAKNEDYPRKGWSSCVLFNAGFYPNRILTPEFVAKSTGAFLHRFQWLGDDQIGDLPASWNRLVMEQETRDDDHLFHWTIGTPCFAEYADCDRADEWHRTFARAITPIVP